MDRGGIVDRLIEREFPGKFLDTIVPDDEELAQQVREAIAARRREYEQMSYEELQAELKFQDAQDFARQTPVPFMTGLPRARKRKAAQEALLERYGKTAPSGIPDKQMLAQLNDDLKAAGKQQVGEKTMRRAIETIWK